jgi:GT2 family glycosyltransferase
MPDASRPANSALESDVVVVLHESRDLLPALVAGLRAQTRPFRGWCFCLNGPEDGSEAWLRALPEAPRIVRRPDNPGFAGGVNAALALSTAPFVMLLNPDVELAPDYHARCREALDVDEGLAAAGGLLWRREPEGRAVVDSAGFRRQPWWRVVDRDAGRPLDSWRGRDEDLPGLCGAALFLRRAALDAVALEGQALDERFWMYKEDQDLAWRLLAAGWRLRFLPGARAEHRRGWRPGQRGDVSLLLRRHSLKNRYLLLNRHFRWRRDWVALPAILCFEVVQALVLLLSEPKTVSGYLWAWRALRDHGDHGREGGRAER